jgi:hypothetical protein
MITLIMMIIILSAGLYGLKTTDSDFRTSAATRRSEVLARAAEAGAAERLGQIQLSTADAGAALDTQINNATSLWPPPNLFTYWASAPRDDMTGRTQYQVTSTPLVSATSTPPAGVQIGSGGQTTIWDVNSYAVNAGTLQGGEHAVSVGVRIYSKGGIKY